ncbi:breast carcinoma-amplified sequence 4 isoform X2 [Bombina bombina]|uniref:breast carcinoma-amplified sequence 4 isoform X2 n=1 Tax=Bombina bombina TaxID=8345 RepID=UPI00235AA555|nr:breast carcinoma-amplified sequence 4 isoform X2 [Bombina bombina]
MGKQNKMQEVYTEKRELPKGEMQSVGDIQAMLQEGRDTREGSQVLQDREEVPQRYAVLQGEGELQQHHGERLVNTEEQKVHIEASENNEVQEGSETQEIVILKKGQVVQGVSECKDLGLLTGAEEQKLQGGSCGRHQHRGSKKEQVQTGRMLHRVCDEQEDRIQGRSQYQHVTYWIPEQRGLNQRDDDNIPELHEDHKLSPEQNCDLHREKPNNVTCAYDQYAQLLTGDTTAEIRNETSHILEDKIPALKCRVEEMNRIYSKIDKLEAFVKMVGHNVAFLEEEVTQAEGDHLSFPQAVSRMLHGAPISLFLRKNISKKSYELPKLYRTEEYFSVGCSYPKNEI